jgi:cold-inducible RNA-binding protein
VRKLFVGNLPYHATETDLETWFSQYGFTVENINLVRDRFSGRMRGFGFVEIANAEDMENAIQSCNGRDFLGRTVVVDEARPGPDAARGNRQRAGSWDSRGRRGVA